MKHCTRTETSRSPMTSKPRSQTPRRRRSKATASRLNRPTGALTGRRFLLRGACGSIGSAMADIAEIAGSYDRTAAAKEAKKFES